MNLHFTASHLLKASTYDLEDGILDSDVEWTLCIDGYLGTGPLLGTLTASEHTIMATVTDADGASTSSTAAIDIFRNNPDVVVEEPHVAVCADVIVCAVQDFQAPALIASFPTITPDLDLVQHPPGPYEYGVTTVTLVVTNHQGVYQLVYGDSDGGG